MIDIVINPENIREHYLECVNTCFNDWGGANMYSWCFERQLGGRTPDLMLLKKGDATLGGSAVTYRHVRLGNPLVTVAIMTGSWTLPAARNQGCFTTIIDQSLLLAKAAKASLLIAFVTETNPSMKRLIKRGAATFPTHYLVSGSDVPDIDSRLRITASSDSTGCSIDIPRFMITGNSGNSHFAYTPEEWRSQFIDRPENMEFVCIDTTCVGIIEKKGVFDRLLAFTDYPDYSREEILRACFARSRGNGRRLFFFTTSRSLKDYAVELGFEHIPGFLTTIAADERALRSALPHAPDGKPMSSGFYDPASPWYIGKWDITTGDRM
ncbi:MAG: hypothetical protein ACYDHW_00210 [Syntrophorhabdaceae bacterium]